MNYKIVLDRTFEKEVKRLAKRYPSLKSDIKVLRDEILANPTAGTDLEEVCAKSACVSLLKERERAAGQGSSLSRW